MIVALETARLVLQPLQLEDAATSQRLFPHWEIVRYLTRSVPWPFPPHGVHAYYRNIALPAMERGDEWHWSLRLKSDPDHSHLVCRGDENRESQPRFLARLALARPRINDRSSYRRNRLLVQRTAFSRPASTEGNANSPSRRISEKTGMRLVPTNEQDYVAGRLSTEIWEVTSEEWRQIRRKQSAFIDLSTE